MIKISPSARWWMHLYNVAATGVAATGPKGYILKGDVLAHVEKHGLKKGIVEESAAVPATPVKKVAASSKVANPNDPFAQSWQDVACDEAFKHAAQNMHVSKKLTAHSYISAKCNVSRVVA